MRTLYYGVSGNGLGHCARALALGNALRNQGYRIVFFSHGRAVQVLREAFPDTDVHEVPGLTFVYRHHRVDWFRTCAQMPGLMARSGATRRRLRDLARQDPPRGIVSDYEPVLSQMARDLKVPLVAVDHQQVLSELELDWSGTSRRHRIPARTSNWMTYGRRPALRVVSSFFTAPWRRPAPEDTRMLVGPLLSGDVLKRTASAGEHVLVYQTSSTLQELEEMLDGIPGEKRVYGASVSPSSTRTIREFDRETFLDDLASCRYAVLNGGYAAMSEALWFGKPVLSLPVRGQVEQEINALYLQRLGMGRRMIDPRSWRAALEEMETNREGFQQAIPRHLPPPGTPQAVEAITGIVGS